MQLPGGAVGGGGRSTHTTRRSYITPVRVGSPHHPVPQGHYLMKLIVACHCLPGTASEICHIEADNRPFLMPAGHIALSRPDSFI